MEPDVEWGNRHTGILIQCQGGDEIDVEEENADTAPSAKIPGGNSPLSPADFGAPRRYSFRRHRRCPRRPPS